MTAGIAIFRRICFRQPAGVGTGGFQLADRVTDMVEVIQIILVSTAEVRTSTATEKQMKISFSSAAKSVLAELESALEDFETARLSGFSGAEQAQYAQLSRWVQDNIRDVLQ